MTNESPKTPVQKGHELLTAAGFKNDLNSGSRGETWVNKHGSPAFVTYYGRDAQNFATKSLVEALEKQDERLS